MAAKICESTHLTLDALHLLRPQDELTAAPPRLRPTCRLHPARNTTRWPVGKGGAGQNPPSRDSGLMLASWSPYLSTICERSTPRGSCHAVLPGTAILHGACVSFGGSAPASVPAARADGLPHDPVSFGPGFEKLENHLVQRLRVAEASTQPLSGTDKIPMQTSATLLRTFPGRALHAAP